MTENEFLKEKQAILKSMSDTVCFSREDAEILEKALEELQAYRAIGTVEHCNIAMEIVKTMIERGTEPVEMNVLHSYIRFENDLVDNGYTFRSLMEARKKMKPKKPTQMKSTNKLNSGYYECPECKNVVGVDDILNKYCPNCGQKLDWSE